MSIILDAVYQDGVFKPMVAVHLNNNQRVSLEVRPVVNQEFATWLESARRLRAAILDEHGVLPDSTPEIAAERRQ